MSSRPPPNQRALSSGVKQQGCEADHLLSTSAEEKKPELIDYPSYVFMV
jgi:hypothetical protein